MYSSRELIEALLARRRRGLSLRGRAAERAPGEFPPGWQAWFESMRGRVGAVTGATAEAIVAIFLAREPVRPAAASAQLNRWQAFSALWRQQWHASGPEPAHERVTALAVTILAHLLLAVLLLWIAWVRFMGAPVPPGEDVIQVEYIGEGTPDQAGGGAPAEEQQADAEQTGQEQAGPAPAPAADAPAAAPPVASSPPVAPAEPAPSPEPPAPQPEPAEAPRAQPLQVTETPAPEPEFALPPTTPPEVRLPVPEVRSLTVQPVERDVELAERPAPPVVRQRLADVPSRTMEVQPRAPRLEMREVPLLVQPREPPQVAVPPAPRTPGVDAPARQSEAREVQAREIPLAAPVPRPQARPEDAGRSPSESAHRDAPPSPAPAGAPSPAGPPADRSGERPTATAAGSGASPDAPPGAWPTPLPGDDWGQSDRERPGGTAGSPSGLFDAEGRPRLPPGTAAPGGGFPPGSDDWTRDQLDRHGTWATRPPLGYEPTRFDEYWIPSGTLLEEWVRRGIKSLSIPIPGTSKKISCVVSILQLGGGCGITDPNLQDQEAIARPPPDIPYKPELQEPQP